MTGLDPAPSMTAGCVWTLSLLFTTSASRPVLCLSAHICGNKVRFSLVAAAEMKLLSEVGSARRDEAVLLPLKPPSRLKRDRLLPAETGTFTLTETHEN